MAERHDDVLVGSTFVSPFTLIVTGFVVSPGANVTVPLAAVKSFAGSAWFGGAPGGPVLCVRGGPIDCVEKRASGPVGTYLSVYIADCEADASVLSYDYGFTGLRAMSSAAASGQHMSAAEPSEPWREP